METKKSLEQIIQETDFTEDMLWDFERFLEEHGFKSEVYYIYGENRRWSPLVTEVWDVEGEGAFIIEFDEGIAGNRINFMSTEKPEKVKLKFGLEMTPRIERIGKEK